ncbi:hypothetical protein [Vibrio marisflavi]|uniref:Uncharacterized protein n=1 Tax=Vibrio marisflavi CECT 7928 TaxID=634439 RepID=A0ABM9A0X1_9VIBR|nr:hypothetical protein [Vibrio marisflavi]CAH0537295.1 hypothetical protein VMF7928_01038 [Vibrio marisflavi CECT 7928]
MWFLHEHLPENLDDFLCYQRENFNMPQEKAFSVSLTYTFEGKENCWKRVWYVTELEVKLMEIDIGESPAETIDEEAHKHIHKFKKDIGHYLNHIGCELIVKSDKLVLQEKLHQD